jgi:hypothetical protein
MIPDLYGLGSCEAASSSLSRGEGTTADPSVAVSSAGGALSTGVGTGTNLRYHDAIRMSPGRAEAQTREEHRAETPETRKRRRRRHGWKTPQYSLLKFFFLSLRFLSFSSSQDSLANGALVIARFLLVTGPGIRPVRVGRKSHNGWATLPSCVAYRSHSLAAAWWRT